VKFPEIPFFPIYHPPNFGSKNQRPLRESKRAVSISMNGAGNKAQTPIEAAFPPINRRF